MKIKLSSIFVDSQDKALQFYTQVLGFIKKADFPVGETKSHIPHPQLSQGWLGLIEADNWCHS